MTIGDRPGAYLGFQTYADGAPRLQDDIRDPDDIAQTTHDAAPAPPARPPSRRRAAMIAGAGVAIVAAFGGGYLAASHDPRPAAPAERSEAAAMAAAPPMNVEVAEAAPPPAPAPSSAKLDVLPPGAVAAAAPRPVRDSGAYLAAPPASTAPAPWAEAPPVRDAAAVAPVPIAPPPPVRTSFDCRDAPTPARAMVCRDGELARMDRRMKQAYAAAVAAGAPADELAADQEDWLAVREDAARYSRQSVASVYRQRIDELDAVSQHGWP